MGVRQYSDYEPEGGFKAILIYIAIIALIFFIGYRLSFFVGDNKQDSTNPNYGKHYMTKAERRANCQCH